jgi:hypothetical protein
MRLHFEETKHTVTRAVLCECGRKFPSGTSGTYYLHRYLLKSILLLFLGFKYLNSVMRIRDPGWRQFASGIRDRDGKKSDPGSGIDIPDPIQQSLTTSQQNKEKICSKIMFSVGVLIRIRRSISRGMKPRIRISTKMSWIRNTDQYGKSVKLINFFGSI